MTIQNVTPKDMVNQGKVALKELVAIVKNRPDKLVVGGKQYLFYPDWQLLGAFFSITASVISTEELTKEIPSETGKFTLKEVIGFKARAVALKDGVEVSAAEAECLFEEKNWTGKMRFTLRSMAQTRACAKALRNCLGWVVKLPDSKIADEVAEEVEPITG